MDISKSPKAANITDFLSCTVVFGHIEHLVECLKYFYEMISGENEEEVHFGNHILPKESIDDTYGRPRIAKQSSVRSEDDNSLHGLCLTDILSVHNKFSKILNWKNSNDSHYCDVTVNVVIFDEIEQRSMIAQVRFTLHWCYTVQRMTKATDKLLQQREKIDNISRFYYKIDCNYQRYQSRIMSLIKHNEINILGKELMWNPNVILSMFVNKNGKKYPILHNRVLKSLELFELYLNVLFHLGYNLLGIENTRNKLGAKFLNLYLNHHSFVDLAASAEKQTLFVKYSVYVAQCSL